MLPIAQARGFELVARTGAPQAAGTMFGAVVGVGDLELATQDTWLAEGCAP